MRKIRQESESDKEFVYFYSICGKKDRAFLDAPETVGKAEDYARLMYIALSFGFKRMAMRIIANVEKGETFQQFLECFPKDTPTVIKWLDDFVRDVPPSAFKRLVVESWEEMRKKADEDDFDITSFLL